MLRRTVKVAVITGVLATLAACNTVRGASEDVKSVANEVDKKT